MSHDKWNRFVKRGVLALHHTLSVKSLHIETQTVNALQPEPESCIRFVCIKRFVRVYLSHAEGNSPFVKRGVTAVHTTLCVKREVERLVVVLQLCKNTAWVKNGRIGIIDHTPLMHPVTRDFD